jgi:ribose transport system ATP-binding protein/rhamnose transport system ATP-binding protein
MRGLAKRFGGVHALRGAHLTIPSAGLIHGLIGENGSGKSTLLGILSGQLAPDSGEIALNGQGVALSSPTRALGHGIAMVSQEMAYAPHLTAAENVLMGRRLARSRWGINWGESRKRAAAVLDRLGVDLDVDLLVRDLRPDQRQMVEIARALSMDTRILILDEPTSSLDNHEAEALFEVMHTLKRQGVSVVFVSHRLDELFAMSDGITVLRDGRTVAEGPLAQFTPDSVIAAMVGPRGAGTVPAQASRPPRAERRAALVVQDLSSPRALDRVSLSVRPGEILGLAGQLGSGRSELLECVFGSRAVSSGTITMNGKPHRPSTPRAAIRAGLAFVPPDRKGQGLVLSGSVRSNLMSVLTCNRRRLAIPATRAEDKIIAEMVARMRVRMHDVEDPASTLSGGNQQKVAIGKWLAASPQVIMLDEPTRGVDVAAKAEVHALLREAAAQGAALLISSSELSELLGLCDRIAVMVQGRVVDEANTSTNPDEETLIRRMTMTPKVADSLHRQEQIRHPPHQPLDT